MKKFLLGILTLSMVTMVFTGCKKQAIPSPSETPVSQEVSLEKVVQDVTTEIGINSPIVIDDDILTQFIEMAYVDTDSQISIEDISEYYGLMCTSGNSSDFILGIKADKSKQKEVLKVLEFVQSTRARSFENFIDDEYEKAKQSKIISIGDYTFIAILGDVSNPDNDVQGQIEEIINSYFAEK